jgi:nucleoside-diphosphate-sugar epimerase
MTSGPTKAMLAAALGKPFHIPFGGRGDFQFTDDTARVFINAARATFEGADVFNLRGSVVHMQEIVTAIEAAEPAARGHITFDDKPLSLPSEMDGTPLAGVIGALPHTPLETGVSTTISMFKQALADGRLPPVVPT